MNITGPAQLDDDTLTPPPKATSRIFTATDHYNAAAEALQQINLHHEDKDFGLADATILIQIAQTHGQLGQLKLALDQTK